MPASPRHQLHDWFEAHACFLYCWLRTRLNPQVRREIDAEDLLQEVWVRATHTEVGTAIANPRAWLLTIARYVFLEAVRGWRRRSRLVAVGAPEAAELPDTVTSLTRRVAREELRQQFFAALDALGDDDRHLLVAHGLEGRPMSEVAPGLGIATEAGHKRWQRLRERLRDLGSPADLW